MAVTALTCLLAALRAFIVSPCHSGALSGAHGTRAAILFDGFGKVRLRINTACNCAAINTSADFWKATCSNEKGRPKATL
jgi:hypothetical protein